MRLLSHPLLLPAFELQIEVKHYASKYQTHLMVRKTAFVSNETGGLFLIIDLLLPHTVPWSIGKGVHSVFPVGPVLGLTLGKETLWYKRLGIRKIARRTGGGVIRTGNDRLVLRQQSASQYDLGMTYSTCDPITADVGTIFGCDSGHSYWDGWV